MLRRLVIAGFAAMLAAPASVIAPASAAVLFSCPGIDSASNESYFQFSPGLSHTQTAQDAYFDFVRISGPNTCTNGQGASIWIGRALDFNAVTTFPSRPLGCPVAWGGVGPDYPDQTPILQGSATPHPNSYAAYWYATATYSYGLVKVKQATARNQWKLVFVINTGEYAPPAGKKTKVKFTATISPYPGYSYTCANDSNPLESVSLTSVGQVIVTQK
jgi:hypothetical protein